MLTTFWSLKGGQGVSTTAALAALRAAEDPERKVVLIDVAGDQPAIFGAADIGTGLGEWMRSDLGAQSLTRTQIELAPNLMLVPAGQPEASDRRAGDLIEWLRQGDADVFVDAGVLHPSGDKACDLRARLAAEADRSVLVTKACYLALRKITGCPVRPSAVVLVAEAGRSLTRGDCERAIGAPVVATVPVYPDVARAVDAGMLRTKVPQDATRALAPLTRHVVEELPPVDADASRGGMSL